MVNGYVTLDLASNNIYKESLGAIKSGKPVMVVDAPNVYFADTIKTATIDDDVVVEITKGGKTITINDANAVSSEGDIQVLDKHLYEHNICIVGDNGNSLYLSTKIITNNNSPMNIEDIYNYLKNNGFNNETNKNYIATGCVDTDVITALYISGDSYSLSNLKIRLSNDNNTTMTDLETLTDTITQLI